MPRVKPFEPCMLFEIEMKFFFFLKKNKFYCLIQGSLIHFKITIGFKITAEKIHLPSLPFPSPLSLSCIVGRYTYEKKQKNQLRSKSRISLHMQLMMHGLLVPRNNPKCTLVLENSNKVNLEKRGKRELFNRKEKRVELLISNYFTMKKLKKGLS